MRCLAFFALLLAPLATPCVADDKTDTRTYWVYEGGWFAKSKDGTWYEMNEAVFRKLGKPYKFGEAKRTKEYVDLYDDSRRTYVRLWDKHAETLTKKGDWEKLLTGQWKKAE